MSYNPFELSLSKPWTLTPTRMATRATVLLAALVLVACGNSPPVPDWQMNAKSSMERAQSAYLEGKTSVEGVEFARARTEVASTGRADLLARIELARCATRVASLVLEDCAGYAALAQDAAAPERAYADYLAGKAQAKDAALLPSSIAPWQWLRRRRPI